MTIFLGIIAAICLMGMIGAADNDERLLFTNALIADVAAIVLYKFI